MKKNIVEKSILFLIDKDYRTRILKSLGIYDSMNDKDFIKKMFKIYMGYELDLENPNTFNEKLQWLKLYDRNPKYTKMVDKYDVKDYVDGKIGSEYIIPTIGVWDHFEDIDFSKLPSQFVLKCTHDCGGLIICQDKSKLDLNKAKKKINRSLNKNYFFSGREWPYKNVKPRIIVEPYIEDSETKELRDYKFFCFDGEVKAMYIATDRNSLNETKFDFFDENFNHLPFTNAHPNAKFQPKKPLNFDKMKFLAEKLSVGIPHVRVDFYEANGKIYFGELTFFHMSGFAPFVPEIWDYKFGEWIKLPK